MALGEMISIGLSALAIVLSVVSLVWQIAKAGAERPEVVVDGYFGWEASDNHDHAVWLISLTIANVGSEPVTITSAWWRLQPADLSASEAKHFWPRGTTDVHPNTRMDVFPLRLEGNDGKTLNWEEPMSANHWDKMMARPSVNFIRRTRLKSGTNHFSTARRDYWDKIEVQPTVSAWVWPQEPAVEERGNT